eukprot:COSAG01_NODE_48015_length_384_cov_170.757895_1_plen_64_part_01
MVMALPALLLGACSTAAAAAAGPAGCPAGWLLLPAACCWRCALCGARASPLHVFVNDDATTSFV